VGQIAGHSAKPRHSNNSAVNNNSLRNATIQAGLEKPGFLKKNPAQCFFFCFFGFSKKKYICPEERVFRVFSVSRILLGASRF
jgi:hypothetical protein